MSNENIIRAWKDDTFREHLTNEELASLPPNPAGLVDLQDADLDNVAGGYSECIGSLGCCPFVTTSCTGIPWVC